MCTYCTNSMNGFLLLNIHGNHSFSVILVNFVDFMGDFGFS